MNKNILLAMAVGLLATACGGGGSTSTAMTTSTPTVTAPTLLTGPNTGAMQVLVSSMDDKQPVSGVIIMIDDGGPTQTTDASGYASFTGLTPGAHNVFAFHTATGAGRFVALMQIDRAHVELQMQRTASQFRTIMSIAGNFTNIPLGSYIHADLALNNGKTGGAYYEGPTLGGMTFQRPANTYNSMFNVLGMNSTTSSLGNATFRKVDVVANGRTTVDSVSLLNANFVAMVGTTLNVIPFDLNFAATPPAPNMSITETAIPPVGVVAKARMTVFPSVGAIEDGLNIYSAQITDKAIPTPYYLTAGEKPIAVVKGGINEGATFITLPGDHWKMYNEIPATGIATHNTGFTGKCTTPNNQTGTTMTFTPATGLVSYHELIMKTSPTAAWYVYAPVTATSVTLPTTVPAGAINPYPAAGGAYTGVSTVSCIYRNGQTYTSFAEGVPASKAGYALEVYSTDVRYSPF